MLEFNKNQREEQDKFDLNLLDGFGAPDSAPLLDSY
jgi:hypothetical protein